VCLFLSFGENDGQAAAACLRLCFASLGDDEGSEDERGRWDLVVAVFLVESNGSGGESIFLELRAWGRPNSL